MEREQEIARLVNVLRQTARMAMQTEWTGGTGDDTAGYCAEQYNRVLGRLKELEPGILTVFEALPPGSSLTVSAMACRQLGAYFEAEGGRGGPRAWGGGRHHRGGPGFRFDGGAIKDFWRESAREVEDLGEFIRESVEEWGRRNRRREEQRAGGPPPPPHPPEPPSPPEPPHHEE